MTTTTERTGPPLPPLPEVDDLPRESPVELAATAAMILADVQSWAPRAVAAADFQGAADLRRRLAQVTGTVYRWNSSKPAILDLQHASRVADRALGQTIRAGQAAGMLRKRGMRGGPNLPGVRQLLGNTGVGIYRLADTSDDEFAAAVEQTRAAGSLAIESLLGALGGDDLTPHQRAQRDRIAELAAEGRSTRQIAEALGVRRGRVSNLSRRYGIDIPADHVVRTTLRVDPVRIITETIPSLEGLAVAAGHLDDATYASLDPVQAKEWAEQMRDALTPIMHMQRALDARGEEH